MDWGGSGSHGSRGHEASLNEACESHVWSCVRHSGPRRCSELEMGSGDSSESRIGVEARFMFLTRVWLRPAGSLASGSAGH